MNYCDNQAYLYFAKMNVAHFEFRQPEKLNITSYFWFLDLSMLLGGLEIYFWLSKVPGSVCIRQRLDSNVE